MQTMISRQEALAQGLPRYFNGVPCKRGHVAPRRVANYNCETCVSLAKRQKTKVKKDAERQKREQETGRCIVTQSEAKAAGMARYFSGTPCPAGHVAERYTRDAYCVQCASEKQAKRYKNDPAYRERLSNWKKNNIEKVRQQDAEYRNRNKFLISERNKKWAASEKGKQTRKKWAEENREHLNAKLRERNKANPEAARQRREKWKRKNPHVVAAQAIIRSERMKGATPSWADVKEIEAIFKARDDITRLTGVPHHVDHYYPVQGETICGLNLPCNLQIIPAWENLAKNNKMPEEFYGEGGREEWLKRRHQ